MSAKLLPLAVIFLAHLAQGALASTTTVGTGSFAVEVTTGYLTSTEGKEGSVFLQTYYGLVDRVDISLNLGYSRATNEEGVILYGASAKYLITQETLTDPAIMLKATYEAFSYQGKSNYSIPVSLSVGKVIGNIIPFALLTYSITDSYFGGGVGLEYPIDIYSSIDVSASYYFTNPSALLLSAGYELRF